MSKTKAEAEPKLREIRFEAGMIIWSQYGIGNLLDGRSPEYLSPELVTLLKTESNKIVNRLIELEQEEIQILKDLGKVCAKCGFAFDKIDTIYESNDGRRWHVSCIPTDPKLNLKQIELNYESPEKEEAKFFGNRNDENNNKSV